MVKVGVHVSIAGTLDLAVDRAKDAGCDVFPMFSRNPRGWWRPVSTGKGAPLSRLQYPFYQGRTKYRLSGRGVLGMATDPVCFAIVDEDTAQFRTTYRDREYYFCTNYCKKQFLKDPKKYTHLNIDISIEPGGASC